MFLWRRHWLWLSPESGWTSLSRRNTALSPSSDQVMKLRTGQPVPRGWYLFGIRHRGENRRCTGWLSLNSNSDTFFRQGRPMYPVRRRWRVLRVRQQGRVCLDLERVQNELNIEEVWLLRLPAFDGWRRIKRRLRSVYPDLKGAKPKQLWRHYNKLLHTQAHRHSLVTYSSWQQQVESPALAALPALTAENKDRLHLFHLGDARIALPAGHWQVVLPSRDYQLSPWAEQVLAATVTLRPELTLIYGDEDIINTNGERHSPQFKPAWNQELYWSDPYYSQCWFISAALWNRWLAAQPVHVDSWQELIFSLLAQLAEPNREIGHIPMVLSHRIEAVLPPPLPAKALERHLPDGVRAEVVLEGAGYRLQWPMPKESRLSVIIPTRDGLDLLRACLNSMRRHPPGCDTEILIVDNGSEDAACLDFLARFQAESSTQQRHCVVRAPGPFNYSRLNNTAAHHCHGDVYLLLNNDVEFLHPGWGAELLSQALRPGIGCVGVQLLYPDETIQHAGVILGIGGIAGHAHQDYPANTIGYQKRLQLSQEVSAVTAACLAISRDNWNQLGGLDDDALAVNYNDVDLGLRAQRHGLKNIYLPQVRAIHHESKSRGRPEGAAYQQWKREWRVMEQRWGELLTSDPAYSPHLSLEAADFTLGLRRNFPLVR